MLDANTSSLEGGVGDWTPWFSTTVSQSTAQAEAGTHSLLVGITAAYGWGVQLSNWPGFAATAGTRTISFWGLAGSGSIGATTMQVQWRNSLGIVLSTNNVALATLSSAWQQATASVVAPTGTAFVSVTFSGTGGVAANSFYLDQIYVGT
jgi:hypothetical protein